MNKTDNLGQILICLLSLTDSEHNAHDKQAMLIECHQSSVILLLYTHSSTLALQHQQSQAAYFTIRLTTIMYYSTVRLLPLIKSNCTRPSNDNTGQDSDRQLVQCIESLVGADNELSNSLARMNSLNLQRKALIYSVVKCWKSL